MPRYDARCVDCGCDTEYVSSIADRGYTPLCQFCGGRTVQAILSAPTGYVKGKFDQFKSTVDGSVITSERDLREHNARNNVVCLHDGYDEETVKSGNFAKPESKLDKKELASDIQESIHMLNQGYKAPIGAENE